jgi:hypothetical protein
MRGPNFTNDVDFRKGLPEWAKNMDGDQLWMQVHEIGECYCTLGWVRSDACPCSTCTHPQAVGS